MRAVRLDSSRTDKKRGKLWIGEKTIHVYRCGFVPHQETGIATWNGTEIGRWARARIARNHIGSRSRTSDKSDLNAHREPRGASGVLSGGNPRCTGCARRAMKR